MGWAQHPGAPRSHTRRARYTREAQPTEHTHQRCRDRPLSSPPWPCGVQEPLARPEQGGRRGGDPADESVRERAFPPVLTTRTSPLCSAPNRHPDRLLCGLSERRGGPGLCFRHWEGRRPNLVGRSFQPRRFRLSDADKTGGLNLTEYVCTLARHATHGLADQCMLKRVRAPDCR